VGEVEGWAVCFIVYAELNVSLFSGVTKGYLYPAIDEPYMHFSLGYLQVWARREL
jgi:hypothetical protein